MKVRSRVRIEDGIDDRGRAIGSAWPVAMAKTRSISNGFVVTAAADLPPRTSRSDLDPTKGKRISINFEAFQMVLIGATCQIQPNWLDKSRWWRVGAHDRRQGD